MADKYIPLRVNRDFGDIITTYFDFFKQNIKKFTNVFLSYNGIFLVGLLITSYLLVSGFIGLIAYENTPNRFISGAELDEKYTIYLITGGILFFVIFIMVMVLNYGLASSYMVKYEEKGLNFDKKEVWTHTKTQFGNILLFILLMILLMIPLIIVSFILLIIPFIGVFAYYILIFFFLSWIGVSFFLMMEQNQNATFSLGEGWKLVSKNFWKSVGVNFIMGILLNMLQIIVYVAPLVLMGIYTFHVVENNVDYTNSIVATIIYTIGLTFALIVGIYSYCLSQFVNGILYYALHEKTYNVHTRSKIDQIGKSE